MEKRNLLRLRRRDLLKFGGALLIGGTAGLRRVRAFECLPCELPKEISDCAVDNDLFVEFYPTSPFILYPFTEVLDPPAPLRPSALDPAPERDRQAFDSESNPCSRHSIWPNGPIMLYRIQLQVAEHCFTRSTVQPIDASGKSIVPPDGIPGPRSLPNSVIWGYNGKFPGPVINADYHKPVLVRFENCLHNDNGLEPDFHSSPFYFGSKQRGFLTHLHNAHTAPESDGNPHFRKCGYLPTEWVDNLYLNEPPGGDYREKQSFWWFHDHFEGYTAAQVYKGLVGLYPIYDPDLDPGDERSVGTYGRALRLPGRRTDFSDGTFKVDYDIPLVLFDCRLNDGVTPYWDFHKGCQDQTFPEEDKWGRTFFRHFPNHGFVGDIFTVNGKAYPCLKVKRRKYRFRFLDASVSRAYELVLMRSSRSPQEARGTQGQWLLPDGERCLRFTQIASEGGLLPFPVTRNSITLWPAKRREVVVDFTRFPGDRDTRNGDEIYLVNIMKMEDGRKPDSDDPDYKVPILKFIIDGDALAEDTSEIREYLRPLPPIDYNVPRHTFELERGGISGNIPEFNDDEREMAREFEWSIKMDGGPTLPFIPHHPLVTVPKGSGAIWTFKSGGGWGHPMHIHQEEHQVLSRNGVTIPRDRPVTDERLADDLGKEDTIALNGSEEIVIFRRFRTFPAYGRGEAPYVAHCHNLAHEDHSMMFGWSILETT